MNAVLNECSAAEGSLVLVIHGPRESDIALHPLQGAMKSDTPPVEDPASA